MSVAMGCPAALGDGGIGRHLQFVREAALQAGVVPLIYSRGPASGGSIDAVKSPAWQSLVARSPFRWLPGTVAYHDSVSFDCAVAKRLPLDTVAYHSFPGYCEKSFHTVKERGGVAVLEAATVHVSELARTVAYEHDRWRMGGNPFSPAWVKRVMREYELADLIVVSSSLQYHSFVTNGISREKLRMAPLGIDLDRFHSSSCSYRGEGEPLRIIQLGQVSLLKGFQYTLEALSLLRDREIELTLFGGIGWRAIRQFIENYRHQGIRVRLGVGDPLSALRDAHVCLHPSLSDGFGLAPLEAMAMSVPAIVTAQTGMQDLIEDGHNGFVIPVRRPDEIAARVVALLEDEPRRQEMGEAARKTAQRYEWSKRSRAYGIMLADVWRTGRLHRDVSDMYSGRRECAWTK